ncbi:MAG: acyl carrier protein [Deltaproteobacteria bacterium]|nr:acyl carrier protein [Deltaproteobacteria bacterium]
MISEKLTKTILTTLKIDEFVITEAMTAGEIPGWDSLNHIKVIHSIEREYNISFRGMELIRMKNLGDLQRLVDNKLKEKSSQVKQPATP